MFHVQDKEIPTRNMHNPRRVGLPNTGRDVIPRSLESAVLHPKRGDSDRCSFELHMHGPDCLELSRPSLRLLSTVVLLLKNDRPMMLPHQKKTRGWPRK